MKRQNAELFIGIVARIGVDVGLVTRTLERVLSGFGYDTKEIKITDALAEIPSLASLPTIPIEERYKSRIQACNELRSKSGQADVMARLAVAGIKSARGAVDVDNPIVQRTAYIMNQLKRPEEGEFFRTLYGEHYVQVSCHETKDGRTRTLAERIAHSHAENPRPDAWEAAAADLMQTDESEERNLHGQRVRDAFPKSDVIVDAADRATVENQIGRFLRGLFGDPRVTPTREEYGMRLAETAALRSSDLSRQVGAAIMNAHSEIQALGCNEVPRSGGGTYWDSDPDDAREFQRGRDSNDERKREVLLDLAMRLRDIGIIGEHYSDNAKLASDLLNRQDDIVRESQIMDSLEYGRTIHAEMNAITDAARGGRSVRGGILYCNTFPCHNCAKHIVASGISEVVYSRPYPKSYARELFSDSIAIDSDCQDGRVQFRQFIGILGPIYDRIFSKGKWKSKDGTVPEFDARAASFVSQSPVPQYLKTEQVVVDGLRSTLIDAGFLADEKPPEA